MLTFKGGGGLDSPHVDLIDNLDSVNAIRVSGSSKFSCSFNERGKAESIALLHDVGDIAYWDGSKIAFIPYIYWNSSLGTPIGVCFIPTSHAKVWGDGKARFLAVTGVNDDGSPANRNVQRRWDKNAADAGLTKYNRVPTWDNTIGGTIGIGGSGTISSDNFDIFTGAQNVVDKVTKFIVRGTYTRPYTVSPYATDGSFYSDYVRVISGYNNALSDFNGKSNTEAIVAALGDTGGEAAKACSLYCTVGTSAGDWYLPSCGELAYVLPRFNIIKSALTACSGVLLNTSTYFSSTESSCSSKMDRVYGVTTSNGTIGDGTGKSYAYDSRPVISLP